VQKKRVNTRGVLKVDGYTDFNPEVNVQINRQTAASKKPEKQGGCCGGKK